MKIPRPLLVALVLVLPLTLLLTWVSTGFAGLHGWPSFVAVLLLGLLEIALVWRLITAEGPPTWLLSLVLLAALLRLALGAFWFVALPQWGYDTEVQRAGYIMEDALHRDDVSWELSQSGKPLYYAFQYYSHTDQYGGLLFHNAAVFRYLGPDVHYPLLTVVVSAAVSSLAVALVWAASKHIWDESTAKLAAWMLALYPEAMLLGSSQMREAFTVTLTIAALYLLLRWWQQRDWRLLAGLALLIVVSLGFSPSYSVLIGFALVLLLAALIGSGWTKRKEAWLVWVGIVVLLAIPLVILLFNIELLFDPEYQNYMTELASGKVQAIFERTPDWFHVPFIVVYGVFRPLLPAALAATGNPLWQGIAIWRALGWTALLFLLFYATFLAAWRKPVFDPPAALLLVNWLTVVQVSYRGGGDMWDNPRYRVAIAAIQVMLAAWALTRQRQTGDPWLRRTLGMAVSIMAWFLVWYIDRKIIDFGWPFEWIPQLIIGGLFTGLLYVLWDWRRGLKKNPGQGR